MSDTIHNHPLPEGNRTMTIKCDICGKKMTDGQKALPVVRVVENHRRGDFVTQAIAYIHLSHLKDLSHLKEP